MTYACSDIHGNYEKYAELLKKLNLSGDDTLYVLGDIVDRGNDGVKILLDMMERPNIVPILGNHDLRVALCLPWILQEITDTSLAGLTEGQIEGLQEWISDGGAPTLRGFGRISREQREDVLDYLRDMDVYGEVTTDAGDFLLTHACIKNYYPDKPLDEYEITEFVFGRPDMREPPAGDRAYRVFGHTPTRLLHQNMGEPPADDIIIKGGKIAIDCACAYGGRLGAVCLDDLSAVYV